MVHFKADLKQSTSGLFMRKNQRRKMKGSILARRMTIESKSWLNKKSKNNGLDIKWFSIRWWCSERRDLRCWKMDWSGMKYVREKERWWTRAWWWTRWIIFSIIFGWKSNFISLDKIHRNHVAHRLILFIDEKRWFHFNLLPCKKWCPFEFVKISSKLSDSFSFFLLPTLIYLFFDYFIFSSPFLWWPKRKRKRKEKIMTL